MIATVSATAFARRASGWMGGLLLVVIAAGATESASSEKAQERALAGMGLAEALTELQERGLKLIFSDRVVRPHMRVDDEPEPGSLSRVLDQLLLPHHLEARANPTGWLVVVRSSKKPPAETRKEDSPGARQPSAVLPVQRVVVSDSIAVTPAAQLAVNVVHKGEPVRGLGAEDFEILIGRDSLEILGLEILDLKRLAGDGDVAVSDLPAGGRRHFLLAFDTGAEVAGSLSRAGEAAARLVQEGFHPADLVGVATLSRQQAPRFALGFTSDRRATAATIDVLTGRSEDLLITDPFALLVKPAQSVVDTRYQAQVPGSKPVLPPDKLPPLVKEANSGFADIVLDHESAIARAERQAALGRLLALADSMTELARLLTAMPGRKHIVLFTEGVDGEILAGLTGASEGERDRIEELNQAIAQGQYWKVGSDERYGDVTVLASFDRMLEEFSRSASVIHPVDTRVGTVDGSRGPLNQDALFHLAHRTGGTYVPGTGKLDQLLYSLVDVSSVTYLLRFARPARRQGDHPPKLRVKLRRGVPGKVLHPPVFTEATAVGNSPIERRLLSAGLITGGHDGGAFRSSVALQGVVAANGYSSVEISVSAELCSLPGACDLERQAEVYVYALAADGSIGDYFARGVTLPGRTESGDRNGFQVRDVLELSAGSYNVRALVVDRRTGARSLATVAVDVG